MQMERGVAERVISVSRLKAGRQGVMRFGKSCRPCVYLEQRAAEITPRRTCGTSLIHRLGKWSDTAGALPDSGRV